MAKNIFIEEIHISYDRNQDELTINYLGNLRKASVYCESLEINGMEIDDIKVKRDVEGRVASIRIENYSENFQSPRMKDIFAQIYENFPLVHIPNPYFKKAQPKS
jgi:hypothetical protein